MKIKSIILFLILSSFSALGANLDLGATLSRRLLGEADLKSVGTSDLNVDSYENAIDPASYMVGSGDVFQIAIIDLPSQEYTATITSNNDLYIPELGEIHLGRINLNEAIKKITERINASLKNNYRVRVALKKVKKVTITVTGNIANPGSYQLQGNFRLLDAIKLANKNILPRYDVTNLRRIAQINTDSTRYSDLLLFLSGNSQKGNPYLYPGDQIHIAEIDKSIRIAGHLLGPIYGVVPLLPGETVKDFLPLLSLSSTADSTYFLLKQGNSVPKRVSRNEAVALSVNDKDVIIIPGRNNEISSDTISLTGEFLQTGTIPILSGITTVEEAISMAGGYTSLADENRLMLIRHSKIVTDKNMPAYHKMPSPIDLKLNPAAGQGVRPEISSSLNDLDAFKDYAIMDLKDAGSMKTVLMDGDEIHVPKHEPFVYVSGRVKNPGIYPFRPGQSIDHYISLAGGYGSIADKPNQYVLAHLGQVIRLKDPGIIQEGDIVVVPASVENKRLSMVYIPVLQATISILSLVVSILYFTK